MSLLVRHFVLCGFLLCVGLSSPRSLRFVSRKGGFEPVSLFPKIRESMGSGAGK